ncbi:unnamed protein product [Adineta steineri]|uniref:Uncharacterized protein n=1 Tax=Adineta steineri TaxID=433720 RepID=A0A818RXF5_9BILA|nr:unnamed protein product [Adineta steineri]CAF3664721.1 unnamed protein product [Adineta steineri]
MSGIPLTSAVSNVWPRATGATAMDPSMSGPMPSNGNGQMNLPMVNNPNLPPSTIPTLNNMPPPVPQQPHTPFPSIQQPFGLTNSLLSNNYATAQSLPTSNNFAPNVNALGQNLSSTNNFAPNVNALGQNLSSTNNFAPNVNALGQSLPPFNPMQINSVPNPIQAIQNEANQRRLTHLEDETAKRKNTTLTLQQMGQQVLQGQMDIQEQVLQYQFMLDQCIESLDHQNFILNGQSEEIALLHAKMRKFEYFIDAFKRSKENNQFQQNKYPDMNFIDNNLICSRNSLPMHPLSMSPFLMNGVARVTSSKFQPFNPRYRSPPNKRSSNPNEPQNQTSSARNSNPVSNTNQ